MLQFILLLFIAFRFFPFYFLSHWTCLRNVNVEGISNSRLAIKQLLIHIHMHVLCSATALISNCIYNFNLIISHARLIKISAVRVAGANAELHSLRWSSPVPSRRLPAATRQSSVLSDPSSFSVPHYYYPRFVPQSHSHSHSPSDFAGSGWVFSSFGRLCRLLNDRRRATIHLQSVSKNVDGIIICCSWMLDCRWNPNILVPVSFPTFVCACVGLYLFNVEDCFVFCLKH